MINSGRCGMYAGDGSEEYREFWAEVEQARYDMGAHEQMRWYVPEAQGHDDFLASLALCAHAAEDAPAPAADFIVRPRPLEFGDGLYGSRW